jgi:hypothetical protein
LAAIGLLHLAINWDWVVHIAASFLARLRKMSALNLVVDGLLFAATVMVTLSGLAISRTVGPAFGMSPSAAPLWHSLHYLSASVAVALFVVHGVLHWRWIAKTVAKLAPRFEGGPREAYATAHGVGAGRDRDDSVHHVGRRHRRDRAHAGRRS